MKKVFSDSDLIIFFDMKVYFSWCLSYFNVLKMLMIIPFLQWIGFFKTLAQHLPYRQRQYQRKLTYVTSIHADCTKHVSDDSRKYDPSGLLKIQVHTCVYTSMF